MPEILTQDQIDHLIDAISDVETDNEPVNSKKYDKKVKEYDFRNPKKFAKEELKLLEGIYDNFARHLASYFSGILRANCQISVVTVGEQTYYEHNNALPDSVLIGVLDIKPFERSILMDISNSITFALIERLLGGAGNSISLNREFTEIEIAVMDKIFNQITVFKKEAWSKILDIEPAMKQIETNSRLIQPLSPDEVVVIIVLDVCIKSVRGTINICIPCVNLETVLDRSDRNQYYLKRNIDTEHDRLIKESIITHINESQLEVRGIIGGTMLTLKEILNLQTGDVIKLEQRIDSDVKVNIENRTWFYGIPGIKRNKKVIKINKVL